jgi:3-methylfumaryl-CoA hydratase
MTEWESWIGRQDTSDDVLDPQQANRMAVTLDREPTFRAGDPLPPAWQ